MANKYKMVDGQSIQLSDDEQTAVDNEQAAATSAIAAVAYKRKRQKENYERRTESTSYAKGCNGL